MNPTESLCMIIDGMDQSKTCIPHARRAFKDKFFAGTTMMRTNLTAIMVHRKPRKIYVNTWFPYFRHDSNAVVSAIAKVLRDMQAAGETLPPRLRVQADNCWRENKNRFVFVFLALLVKYNIFTEVEIGFMLVGHTHCDVDATFSIFSRKLNQEDAFTMEELFSVVVDSHNAE